MAVWMKETHQLKKIVITGVSLPLIPANGYAQFDVALTGITYADEVVSCRFDGRATWDAGLVVADAYCLTNNTVRIILGNLTPNPQTPSPSTDALRITLLRYPYRVSSKVDDI
jgi:hypothetical protein